MSHHLRYPLLRRIGALVAARAGALPRVMRVLCALGLAALLLSPAPAAADPREFPPSARPGTLVMGMYPEAGIDGKPVRFAPGARIRDRSNMLVLPGALEGRLRVRYTIDGQGLVDRAWVLTDEEAALAARERR